MMHIKVASALMMLIAIGSVAANERPMPQRGIQDRAFTIADQHLLNRVREEVLAVIGATEGWSPVGLIAKNGTVTLLGTVATPQERERVLTATQETYGVARIVDALEVWSERRQKQTHASDTHRPARSPGVRAKSTITRTNQVPTNPRTTTTTNAPPSRSRSR